MEEGEGRRKDMVWTSDRHGFQKLTVFVELHRYCQHTAHFEDTALLSFASQQANLLSAG